MKPITQLVLATAAALFLATGLVVVVNAADPGGHDWGHGYFTNRGRMSSGFGQVIVGGVPHTTSKARFIDFIKDKIKHGSSRDKTGAQFIVQLMRGAPFDHNRPSTADVNDWEDRINDGSVSLHLDPYSFNWNSGFMKGYANDDTFYPDSDRRDALVFKVGGKVVFVLKEDCANPLGKLGGLPTANDPPPPPDVDPPVPPRVRAAGCDPMQIVVTPGKDALGDPIPIRVTGPLPPPLRNLGTYAVPTTKPLPPKYANGDAHIIHFEETRPYISGYSPIHKTIGGRRVVIGYTPIISPARSWNDTVGPCYDYALTPHVSLGGKTAIESGGDANIANTVENIGPTKSENVVWRLTQFTYKPGTSLTGLTAARDSADSPCNTFSSVGRVGCGTVPGQEDNAKVFPTGISTFTPPFTYTAIGNLSAGTKICFAVSVASPTEDPTPVWRHSEMECLVINKKPKVQIHGGDVRVGGKIETGTSTIIDGAVTKTYGSWVEYGAFAVNGISGFASGSGLNNGSISSPDTWSKLTFANINNGGTSSLGHYAATPTTSAFIDKFLLAPSVGAPSGDLATMNSGRYDTGDFTITGGEIGQSAGKGKSIIIVSSGTVTIDDDIFYRGVGGGDTFASFDQIPQLVIIAKDIAIKNAVTHVDAWLLTSGGAGTINTCLDVAFITPLTSLDCSNPLTVNGPVVTSHLYLRRTAGANTASSSGESAETFNLPAYTDIWLRRWSSEKGKAQTTHTKELPPRF